MNFQTHSRKSFTIFRDQPNERKWKCEMKLSSYLPTPDIDAVVFSLHTDPRNQIEFSVYLYNSFLTYFSLSKTTTELLIWRVILQHLPPKNGSMEVTFQNDCVLIYSEQTLLSQELLTSLYWNSGPCTRIMNILTKKFLLLLWESENFTVTSKAKCEFFVLSFYDNN